MISKFHKKRYGTKHIFGTPDNTPEGEENEIPEEAEKTLGRTVEKLPAFPHKISRFSF